MNFALVNLAFSKKKKILIFLKQIIWYRSYNFWHQGCDIICNIFFVSIIETRVVAVPKKDKRKWQFFFSCRFLVTYSLPENRWADDTNSLRVFDTMTGEMRRGFSLLSQEGSNELPCWPYFQYSSIILPFFICNSLLFSFLIQGTFLRDTLKALR